MKFTNAISEKIAKQKFKTSSKVFVFIVSLLFAVSVANADWNIDFSRRSHGTREADLNGSNHPNQPQSADAQLSSASDRRPASVPVVDVPLPQKESGGLLSGAYEGVKSVVGSFFDSSAEPVQEIVILNTEKGFVPNMVRVRKDARYKIHVVNVNEKEKNVSFILDGFSEHHATFYGKVQTFLLEPKKEGVFSFESPETAAEGKLVVFNAQGSSSASTARAPSSEETR